MKKHGMGKISDVCWGSSEMTSAAGGVMGLGHKGLESSLDIEELGRKPRPLRGFCQHCLVVIEKRSQPSSPLEEPPSGQAFPRDQGLYCSGSYLPRYQAPGLLPNQVSEAFSPSQRGEEGEGLQRQVLGSAAL